MSSPLDGLYPKYRVMRVDAEEVQWAFVLEDKDPIAPIVLMAYADLAILTGWTPLGKDLRDAVRAILKLHTEDPDHRCGKISACVTLQERMRQLLEDLEEDE